MESKLKDVDLLIKDQSAQAQKRKKHPEEVAEGGDFHDLATYSP